MSAGFENIISDCRPDFPNSGDVIFAFHLFGIGIFLRVLFWLSKNKPSRDFTASLFSLSQFIYFWIGLYGALLLFSFSGRLHAPFGFNGRDSDLNQFVPIAASLINFIVIICILRFRRHFFSESKVGILIRRLCVLIVPIATLGMLLLGPAYHWVNEKTVLRMTLLNMSFVFGLFFFLFFYFVLFLKRKDVEGAGYFELLKRSFKNYGAMFDLFLLTCNVAFFFSIPFLFMIIRHFFPYFY